MRYLRKILRPYSTSKHKDSEFGLLLTDRRLSADAGNPVRDFGKNKGFDKFMHGNAPASMLDEIDEIPDGV